MHQDRVKWDERYRSLSSPSLPNQWLVNWLPNLPRGGTALDLAAGDGGNALFLASRGFRVQAVDISPVGLAIGRKIAGPLPIDWTVADLDDWLPAQTDFDVITCFRFLDRRRLPMIVERSLRLGGWFIAETFRFNHPAEEAAGKKSPRPANPEHLLQPGEWLKLFPTLEILAHEEPPGLARLFARRPKRFD